MGLLDPFQDRPPPLGVEDVIAVLNFLQQFAAPLLQDLEIRFKAFQFFLKNAELEFNRQQLI